MRKRIWLVGLVLIGVLLLVFGATTVFAEEPVVPDNGTANEIHQACQNGDHEAMAELHDQHHGEGGTMTGGMMGNGSGGMMGSGSGGMMGNGSGGMMGSGSGGMMGNGSGGMMGNGGTGNCPAEITSGVDA